MSIRRIYLSCLVSSWRLWSPVGEKKSKTFRHYLTYFTLWRNLELKKDLLIFWHYYKIKLCEQERENITYPVFATHVTKTHFVVVPPSKKIYRSVYSTLNYLKKIDIPMIIIYTYNIHIKHKWLKKNVNIRTITVYF